MAIVDKDLKPNNNDGAYPGIGGKAFKNLVDADQDGFYAIDGLLRFTFPDGPTQSQTFTPDLQGSLQVLNVQVIKIGGAGGPGDTVQLFSDVPTPGVPVSDAISLNVPNKQFSSSAQIDANGGNNVFSNSDPLRITRTKVSNANVACIVFVKVARSA